MDRRLAGAALLGAVLLASAAVPRLSKPGVPGLAGIAAQVQPRVGDCVVQTGRVISVVSCATRHTAEVSMMLTGAQTASQQRRQDFAAACAGSAPGYVGLASVSTPGSPGSEWLTSELDFSAVTAPRGRPTSLLPAPGGQDAPAAAQPLPNQSQSDPAASGSLAQLPSWRACLIRPTAPGPGYTGSIRGMTATGVLPVELRGCYRLDDSGSDTSETVSCVEPHHGEILATRSFTRPVSVPGSPADDPELSRQCRDLAQTRIGAADSTFAGRLTSRLRAHQTAFIVASTGQLQSFSPGPPRPTRVGQPVSSAVFAVTCSVQLTGPQRLTDSLVSLGDQPFPVQ